ncbi:MAG: RNA methyltransferase [Candidatus Cloacimonetes bacterium]|nr:RNA methyltransferase [Candidatus Cloacimonadota bacterium]MDD3097771.1 RNA methyltransferase [Candidatus Cloacimonadota bacterium]MDD4034442.1 RNA methyltransferase [Candidatus Cloacimonadota bacterium]MDY0337957.1 RNA methyltransferase [Candidatus Cloacimonadaceae bacterium]HPF08527.1 RNA methyltransferase [Candidatus Cloacimonadota bacterium]
MKFIATYSKEKFQNFSLDSQIKALNKLLKALEDNLNIPDEYQRVLGTIMELSSLCREALPGRLSAVIQGLNSDPYRSLRALAQYFGDASYKDNQISLRTGDGARAVSWEDLHRSAQITLIADNLRSVFNVGSLFRLCECLQINELVLCGITPDPSHPNMAKTALGTMGKVKWRKVEDTRQVIDELRNKAYTIYALETAEPSHSAFEVHYSLPLALVVGNEALGISESTLALCDSIIHLPVLGWKNSLNVSVATSIAIYQIMFGDHHG